MAFSLEGSRDLLRRSGPPPATTPADDNHGLRAHHPSKGVGEAPAYTHAHRGGDARLGHQITVLFSDEGVLPRASAWREIRNHPRDQHHDASGIAMREVAGLGECSARALFRCRDHLQLQPLHDPTIGIAA